MDGVSVLLLCSLAMFVGSFVSGSIPLFFHLTEKNLIYVTLLGIGMLTGTALGVIIPEGIQSISNMGARHAGEHNDHKDFLISICLLGGFAIMFLLNQMFHGSHIHNHAHSQHDLRDEDSVMNKVYKSENEKFPSIFVGIMAHASADGFAMGAALMDKVDSSVGMVIFLALILHKAPESFGLVTTLLQLRYSRRRIRRYLLVYAIAAPLGALLTNFVLRALFLLSSSGSNKGESINLAAVAGYMLLVSGGMLLNVALCHAFPEAMEQASMLSASCDSNNIDIAMSGIKQYETHQSDDTLASPHTVASGCVQPDNYFVSSQPRVDINEIGYGVETHLNSKNNTFGSRDFHNHHSNNLQTHQNHSYSHSHGHSHKLSTSQVVCLCVGVFLPALITLNHHH